MEEEENHKSIKYISLGIKIEEEKVRFTKVLPFCFSLI